MLEPQFQEILSFNDPLASWRKKYWDRFRDLGSFELKQEAFQYIPLHSLHLPPAARKKEQERLIPSSHPLKVVFIDGFFSKEHSFLGEEMICLPLSEAIHSYGVFLQNRLNRIVKEENDPFAALNGAFQGEGAFLYIPPQREWEGPIHIEQFFTGSDMASPRLMLYVGRQSKIQVVQHWMGLSEEPRFANGSIDVVLDTGAELTLKTGQGMIPQTHLFQSLRASLKRDSRFIAHLYSEGGKMVRHSIKVDLLEENAQTLLQGVSDLQAGNESHIHATVEHVAPHTYSRQHFKALLRDQSRSSFEGKIYVHPAAQKTESYQLSNQLLLSDQAMAYSKPNLEIFADDVKASHGATICQLDKEHLFYLRSRGLGLEEAKICLIQSFIRELAHCLPPERC